MKKRNSAALNPFDENLDFTQDFINDALDSNKKSTPHIDRVYPTAIQSDIIENEQIQANP